MIFFCECFKNELRENENFQIYKLTALFGSISKNDSSIQIISSEIFLLFFSVVASFLLEEDVEFSTSLSLNELSMISSSDDNTITEESAWFCLGVREFLALLDEVDSEWYNCTESCLVEIRLSNFNDLRKCFFKDNFVGRAENNFSLKITNQNYTIFTCSSVMY